MDKGSERVSMLCLLLYLYQPLVAGSQGSLLLYLMSCFLVVLQAGNEYSVVWGWLQCLLSFSLLRSAI